MTGQSIETLHRNKIGKVSDKWDSYLGYYDALLGPRRHLPVSILEIGVQNGGSLETWAEYFKSGERFVGCDINRSAPRLNTMTRESAWWLVMPMQHQVSKRSATSASSLTSSSTTDHTYQWTF
jgi:hypothetical protein